MGLGFGKDTSERRQQPQPIIGHKWSWHTKFKLPFPIMVLLQNDICHYAEQSNGGFRTCKQHGIQIKSATSLPSVPERFYSYKLFSNTMSKIQKLSTRTLLDRLYSRHYGLREL